MLSGFCLLNCLPMMACYLHIHFQHDHPPLNHNPKSPVTLEVRRIKGRLLMIGAASSEQTSEISSGYNRAIRSNSVLIEEAAAKSQKIKDALTEDSNISERDRLGMNVGLMGSDFNAGLSALRKKEEGLQDAESRILSEQAKLGKTKKDLARREQEIAAAFVKKKQTEDDLKKATHNLASKTRQIKDLKLLVKDQSKKITDSQPFLSLNEDEMGRLRDEHVKKDEEAKAMSSELELKKQLLDEATEIIRKQEEKIKELEREVTEKDLDLAETLQRREVEQERLKIAEAELVIQSVEWLSAREELKALAEQASDQMNTKETSEEYKRIRKLLSDLRSELILSQQSLASSKKKTADQALLLEEKVEELNKQKLLVTSYVKNLKNAEVEVENERTKLKAAETQLDDLRSQVIDERKMVIHLKAQVQKERATLEQRTQEITSHRMELQQKELEYDDAQNLLRVKESELAEARREIEHIKSEQTSVKLALQEKDTELSKTQKALVEVHNHISVLQKLMNSKEEELIEANTRLNEKEDLVLTMQLELDDTKVQFSEAASLLERIVQLSNKFVVSERNEETFLSEPKMAKESLREKERAPPAEEEELKTREKEIERMEELVVLGNNCLGAAQLEPEATICALQKIAEVIQQLSEENDCGLILYENFDGVKVAEKEATRLFDLTEKLVTEAGITATTDSDT